MKFFNRYILSSGLTVCVAISAHAQVDTTVSLKAMLTLPQFLNKVGKDNLGYAAQKYNVNIAEAGIESAKVFPDPQLSFDVFDDQHQKLGLAQGFDVGLGTTIELGGKRRSRIDLAKSQTALSQALLLDFFRNLQLPITMPSRNFTCSGYSITPTKE